MNFNRILCPVVLSPASQEPLRYAAALASAYRARLFICHWTGERSDTPTDGEVVREKIKQLLEESVHLETRRSENGEFDWEQREDIDLISIGARGTRSEKHPLFGSNVDHVLRRSRCPVLVARAIS